MQSRLRNQALPNRIHAAVGPQFPLNPRVMASYEAQLIYFKLYS